jgi:FkbM family methyltransferase
MQYRMDDADQNGENWILTIVGVQAKRFVDVGANKGNFSAAFRALSPDAAGYIFEPGLVALEWLGQRFSRDTNIHISRKAISDTPGSMDFFEEPGAGLGSSLIQACARESANRIRVDVTTLDLEFQSSGVIDYVKIDAEGHDLNVLRGAHELLSSHAIRFLQFEYHVTWIPAGATLRYAINLLAGHGYRVFLLKGKALHELSYDTYGEYFSYSNYFAVRPEDFPVVAQLVKGPI